MKSRFYPATTGASQEFYRAIGIPCLECDAGIVVRPRRTQAYGDNLELDGRLTIRRRKSNKDPKCQHRARKYEFSLLPSRDRSISLFSGNHNHLPDHRLNLPPVLLSAASSTAAPGLQHHRHHMPKRCCCCVKRLGASNSGGYSDRNDLGLICSLVRGCGVHAPDSCATSYTNTKQ